MRAKSISKRRFDLLSVSLRTTVGFMVLEYVSLCFVVAAFNVGEVNFPKCSERGPSFPVSLGELFIAWL